MESYYVFEILKHCISIYYSTIYLTAFLLLFGHDRMRFIIDILQYHPT